MRRVGRCVIVLAALTALTACGGQSSEPSTGGSDPTPATGTPSTPPSADPGGPASSSPPAAPALPATSCSMTGTARQFSSAAEQAAALVKAWASCGDHPICPESDPYLLISSGADASALCGHWCPGDGGHCATTDAAYRFTYAVANGGHDIGAFVLELDSQASNGRYSITWWDALPYPVMKLASLATGETTTLQGVGVPVQ